MKTDHNALQCGLKSNFCLIRAILRSYSSLKSLMNVSNHWVLIWNGAPCVVIHFNLEVIYTSWQKFPRFYTFYESFFLCLMAINSKKYIKTSIKIIYVFDYFYCQKSKHLFQFKISSEKFYIYLVWNVLCNAVVLETRRKIR